jgi:ABC-type glycerol-3-phosphate transport system permease component
VFGEKKEERAMKSRKEITYGILLLIAAVLFVLPCIFLAYWSATRSTLCLFFRCWFICAYKNTAILAIAGVLIQIVIALPAGYAIARIPSPKTQTFFLLTCVFFLLLPQQALMLPQYLVLMIIGWLDSLKGLLIMTAFQPWMILLFWFAAKRIDSSLFDAAICDGASNWVLFRKIYVPIIRPYVAVAAFLSIAESWNLLEQPMTFLQSKEKYPLSMILMQLSTDNAELKNALCLLFVIPLIILFIVMIKRELKK